ncbi:hypothetical protein AFLA_002249 [Aspergillus flavus NRRL3357]|nr:hypothetical protein AFLA_002249 [Aspergillus flavus NRRL3357]
MRRVRAGSQIIQSSLETHCESTAVECRTEAHRATPQPHPFEPASVTRTCVGNPANTLAVRRTADIEKILWLAFPITLMLFLLLSFPPILIISISSATNRHLSYT